MHSEGYSGRFVCVSVHSYSGTTGWWGGLWAILAASERRDLEKQKDDFPEVTMLSVWDIYKQGQAFVAVNKLSPRAKPEDKVCLLP